MRFITGTEISVTWAGQTVHIVGLGFDADDQALARGLHATRAGRTERARRMGQRLADMGMPGAYEGALPFAGNPELVSRTHSRATWCRRAIVPTCRPCSTNIWETIVRASKHGRAPV